MKKLLLLLFTLTTLVACEPAVLAQDISPCGYDISSATAHVWGLNVTFTFPSFPGARSYMVVTMPQRGASTDASTEYLVSKTAGGSSCLGAISVGNISKFVYDSVTQTVTATPIPDTILTTYVYNARPGDTMLMGVSVYFNNSTWCRSNVIKYVMPGVAADCQTLNCQPCTNVLIPAPIAPPPLVNAPAPRNNRGGNGNGNGHNPHKVAPTVHNFITEEDETTEDLTGRTDYGFQHFQINSTENLRTGCRFGATNLVGSYDWLNGLITLECDASGDSTVLVGEGWTAPTQTFIGAGHFAITYDATPHCDIQRNYHWKTYSLGDTCNSLSYGFITTCPPHPEPIVKPTLPNLETPTSVTCNVPRAGISPGHVCCGQQQMVLKVKMPAPLNAFEVRITAADGTVTYDQFQAPNQSGGLFSPEVVPGPTGSIIAPDGAMLEVRAFCLPYNSETMLLFGNDNYMSGWTRNPLRVHY